MSFAGAVLAPLGTTKLGGAQVFGAAAQVGTVSQGTFEITTPKERPFLCQVSSAPRVDIAAAYPGADGTAIDLGAMDGMPVIGSTWPTTRVGAGISPWAHTEVHTDADRMNAVPTRPEMSEVRMRFPRELTGIGHAR